MKRTRDDVKAEVGVIVPFGSVAFCREFFVESPGPLTQWMGKGACELLLQSSAAPVAEGASRRIASAAVRTDSRVAASTSDQGEGGGGKSGQPPFFSGLSDFRVHRVDGGATRTGGDVLDMIAKNGDKKQMYIRKALAEAEDEAPPASGADRSHRPQLLDLGVAAHDEKHRLVLLWRSSLTS